MVLDLAVLHDNAALQTNAIANHHVGPDDDVGTNAAVLANLGRGVDHDVPAVHIRFGGGGQLLGVALSQRGKVQAGARQEILGLADIHPEAVQVKGVQLAVLADGGEGLLLDGGGAQLNALEDAGVQDVDTGVDAVADELDGFLDEAVDARGVIGLVHDDTVLGGLVHLGDDDGALFAVAAVECGQLLERIVADDVGVQHEEGRVVLSEDLLGQLERASRAQRFRLDGEFNPYVVLLLVLLEGCDHDIWAIVDRQYDIGDPSGGQALDLVQDHGPVAKFHEWLGKSESLDRRNMVSQFSELRSAASHSPEDADGSQTLRQE